LLFKCNPLNRFQSDASILVGTGTGILGVENGGSMKLTANNSLLLGLTCPNIQIGTQVSYLNAVGVLPNNVIIIGNQYSIVIINGALNFQNIATIDPNGRINYRNIGNRMRQF